MKKLTKEQLNERKRKLNKFARITLYISLAFNVLFTICLFVGCSQQKSNVQQIEKVERQRNYLASDDYNGSYGYNVIYPVEDFWDRLAENNFVNISGGYSFNNLSFYAINTNGDVLVDSDGIVDVLLYNDGRNGHFQLSLNGNVSYTNDFSVVGGGNIVYTTHTLKEVYFSCLYNNNKQLADILDCMYDRYTDIYYRDLSFDFNPNNYLTYVNDYWSITAPGVYRIINDGLIYCNGSFYDYLSVIVDSVDGKRWKFGDEEPQVINETPYTHVMAVILSNFRTDTTLIIMNNKSTPFTYYNNGVPINSSYLDGSFTIRDFNNVKLFQYRNVNPDGVGTAPIFVDGHYNNYNALTLSSSNSLSFGDSVSYGDGQLGNVFNLFTTAFTGLGGLFAIKLLPGITLGMLLFVPLIGIIVFAIVRIIKK